MENLPAQKSVTPELIEPSRVVDAELVGYEMPTPLWRRVLGRAVLAIVLGCIGLVMLVIGVILTITVIGAAVGIPLMLLGLILCLFALFAPLARGPGRFTVVHWPR